ncbi:MAG TPA: hypothetical protein VGW39_14845 [Chthoniobacterales bacterium]|nr:hypothetical protein [Chthoniobacterales bacterium]
MLQQPLERLVAAHENAKGWAAAIQTAETLVELAPKDIHHENRLVDIVFSRAVSKLRASDDSAVNRDQALLLQQQIAALEGLQLRFADNGDVYESLAGLHHLRGVKLANAGALSDALLEVQKALVLQPSFPAAIETWKQLVQALENLQKQIAELEAKMGGQANLALSEKGEELRRMATTGFKKVTAYAKSDVAVKLASAATRARNRSLWRSIGLPEPLVDWDNRAAALLAGMNRVAAQQPADQPAIAAEWEEIQKGDPPLSQLDSEAICRFLASRLLEEKEESARQAQPSAEDIQANAPMLRISKDEPRGGGAPFSFWLTSPIDIGIKGGWAAALALMLTATTLHLRETHLRQQRANAYAALSAAVTRDDPRAALEAAVDFFAARPIAQDGRDFGVSAVAQESLVRWITQQSGELTALDARLIDRFRQLVPQKPANNNP